MKKLFTKLTFWVLFAISAGALLGHFFPDKGVAMQPLGKYFIDVVKLFINPIIFLTISLGISGMAWDGAPTVPCRCMQGLVLVCQDIGVAVAHLASELQENWANPLRAPAFQG